MAPATLSHRVLSLIYPLKEPARRRQHDKSLSVLALGLSRSGTESLRHALEHLSYRDCYHGFKCGRSPPDAKVWCRLLAYKAQLARKRALSTDTGDTSWWHFDSGLTREVFDRILADCQAVTDVPCSMFVDELIRCYPDAKVVINFREDVEAWHASIKANVLPTAQSWLILVMSLFNSDFFWWFYFFRLTFNDIWGLGNWDARGQLFYEEHYTHLRRVTKQHGREALEWRATDGWAPLCKFLGQPIPDRPFPQGNATPELQERMKQARRRRYLQSMKNISIILGLLIGGFATYTKMFM